MNNRRSVIFLCFLHLTVTAVFAPGQILAEDIVTIPGIVEVEENHLYMVPIGTDDGVGKGDTVEIVRNDQKIADARLISVLPDNSMAEIVVLFVRTDVLESDSVRFFKEGEARKEPVRRTTLGRDGDEEDRLAAERAEDERRRGLLGSDMHRYEETVAVEGPLQEEIKQLKAGLVSVRNEYEDKVETILSSVGGEKDALAVEKKWKDKLLSTEKRYEAQYNERKKLLEKDQARMEAKVAQLQNELRVVNEGTDRRIEQLLSDLKDKQDEISVLKQTFVEEHLTSEKQWKMKLESLEAQYQDQLRKQKEAVEKESAKEREKYQADINYYTEQVELTKQSTKSDFDDLQVRLKEREDLVDSQRRELIALESDLSREQEQVRKLESDVATLKDVIGAAKRVHEKELEQVKKPLETKIEDMSVDFIAMKNDYEEELNAIKSGSKQQLMEKETEWVEKLATVEQKYQSEISKLNTETAGQVNELRAELNGRLETIEMLKQDKTELTAKLQATEKQVDEARKAFESLRVELAAEKASRSEQIDLAKKPLTDKVAELSAEIVALRDKQADDASLIDFLNNAMADLTAESEEKDSQIAQLQEGLKISQGENEAMKKSHVERIALAKKPLEEQIESLKAQVVAMNAEHANQVTRLQESASRDLLASEERWQTKLVARENELQKELDAEKDKIYQRVKELEESVVALNNEHEIKLSEIQKSASDGQAALEQQWQARLKDAEAVFQRRLEDEAVKNEKVIEYLKEEKAGLLAQITSLKNDYEMQVREMEAVAKEGQAAINEEWQKKIEELKQDHQKQLVMVSEEKQKAVTILEQEKKGLTEKIDAILKDHEAALKVVRENSEKEKAALTSQIAVLRKDHEAELKEKELAAKGEQDSVHKQWEGKFADLKAEHEKQIVALKDENTKLIDEMSVLKREYAASSDSQERALAGLNKQLDSMKKDSSSIIEDLQSQLRKKEDEVDALAKENARMASDLTRKTSQLTKAEDGIGILEKRIKETESSRSKWIASVKKPLEEEIRELNSKVSSLKKDHEQEITALKREGDEGLMGAEKRYQEELARLEIENTRKLDEQRKNFEQRIVNLNEQLDLAKGNSDETIKALRSQLEDRRQLIAALEKRVSDLAQTLENRDRRVAELDDSVSKLGRELDTARASYDDQVKIAKRPLEEQIKSLNQEIASQEDKAKSELKAIEKEWQEKLKEKDKEIARIRKRPEAEWKEKLAAAEEKYQKDLRAKEEALQTQIAELNRQMGILKSDSGDVIDQLQDDLKRKQDLVANLENEKSELQMSLNRKVEEIGGLKEDLRASSMTHSEAVRKAKAPLEDEILSLKKEMARAKSEYEDKLGEGPREVAALKDQLQELRGESEQEIELLRKELETERRIAKGLEEDKAKLTDELQRGESDQVKRLELAKSSLEAEVKKLNTELSFLKDEYDRKTESLQQKAQDDQQETEKKWEAKLAASEAQWKTKWAVREAEHQEEMNVEMEKLEGRIFGGKKEVQETIVSLNNRLKMLKDGSDSQIRDMEAVLAEQQYQLTVKEADHQQRLMEVEKQWTDRMNEAEKRHQDELAKQKKTILEGYLEEKKELRETVVDLTRQFNELRDTSNNRIRDLENALEQKEYKLSLLENRSQQDLTGTEEKWQARLAAEQEKRQRELLAQQQEMEKQFLMEKEKLQAQVTDLNRQIGVIRDQAKLDLALKEEEAAANKALLEKKYQEQMSSIKEGSIDQTDELAVKIRRQQDMIDSLEKMKADFEFNLDQRERELDRAKAEIDELKKELKTTELSESEELRLVKSSLESKIEQLTGQLKIAEDKATQEREETEDRWRAKLDIAEQDYLEKLKLQREKLEEEAAVLENKFGMLKNDQGGTIKEMQIELEDNQTLIRLLSKEKYELSEDLEEKSRMIVRLNEEIIDLKSDLETYKDMLPLVSSMGRDTAAEIIREPLASPEEAWYDDANASKQAYYDKIRSAILEKFKQFDFSDYEGKEGVIKIDFELFANGSPVGGPEFLGTQDQGLKDLLTQCFEEALPFPPFPDNLGKESQRFSLGISFKRQ